MNFGESSQYELENSITILTQGIARLLDVKCPRNKVDKYIKHLQTLCFGSPEDKFSKYFGLQLTQDECVDCLLSVGDVQDYCLANPQEGLKIANQLLCLTKLTGIACQFLSCIVPSLVSCMSIQDMRPTLESLWKQKDKSKFPLVLLECALLERKEVESDLLKAYLESVNNLSCDIALLKYWVKWSCHSPFIFQSISTILNNILIHSNNRQIALKMITEYILLVKRLCLTENVDFVKLYPLEFQSLVVVLRLDPDSIRCDPSFDQIKQFIVKSVKPLHFSDPHVAVMLLSHFAKWLPVFNSSKLIVNDD